MTTPYHALIFDMDGVLADSEPVYHAAMLSVLQPLGHTLTEEQQRHVMGLGIEDCWRYLAASLNLQGPTEHLVSAYNDELLVRLAQVHETLPGVRGLIDALRQRNIPIAVASSSLPDWIEALLGGIELLDAFDALVSRRMVANGKPAPDIYLHAARLLKADPARCIAIEDTPNGLASAVAAGMLAVQVRAASTAFPPLPNAHLVLDSLLDFPLALLDAPS
ncbi:MAG TPA: HAD family phosphatase [Dehalococcoidia bacterium]|nr:HAD family phosphatase [Dehalococcoidia bacterium]